jgi:hypothetical protein
MKKKNSIFINLILGFVIIAVISFNFYVIIDMISEKEHLEFYFYHIKSMSIWNYYIYICLLIVLLMLVIPRFYVNQLKNALKALINIRSFEIQLSPIG